MSNKGKEAELEKVTIIDLFWSSPIPRNPCEGHKKGDLEVS